MVKHYLPKALTKSRLDPCFNSSDVIYMRYVKDGKTVRVARMDPSEGMVFALYPTANPGQIEGEAFSRVDDDSPRILLEKSRIKDEVWIALIEGNNIPEFLSKYPLEGLGLYPSGSYKYGEESGSRTFHVVEIEEHDTKRARPSST